MKRKGKNFVRRLVNGKWVWRRKYGVRGVIGPARGFTWAEVQCTDGTHAPQDLRRNVVKQAALLNKLRYKIAKQYGAKKVVIRVNSWYRTPTYNSKIRGASSSYHLRAMATDLTIIVVTRSGKTIKLTPAETGMLAAKYVSKFNKGGIGVYPAFTHLDHRGYTSRW